MKTINITDIEGIKIGHEQDIEGATGCTVILCEDGACGGVDVRGGAPGTRETDLLNPMNLVDKVHAVLLAGGSAFGLDAAAGIMEYLEKNNCGFDVGVTKVPIVVGAVIFDLYIGNSRIRPDKGMGHRACINASSATECQEGNIGVGTGATVGKYLGVGQAMKSGLGICCFQIGDLKVGAIVAVNCFGDIIDPTTGKIIAGTLSDDGNSFADTESLMIKAYDQNSFKFDNTTIGTVITNATLSKAQANKVASMAQNGLGRTIRPAHTMYDGDTIFSVATGKIDADVNTTGLLAARAMEFAVVRAIKKASPMAGLKSYSDMKE